MSKLKLDLKNFGKKTVLIIDDDQDITDTFRWAFELEEYKVLSAGNGREALDLLKTLPDTDLPDLIMLDYMMPIMNGSGFCMAVSGDLRLSSIPVVLMTANGNIVSLMNDIAVDAYVEKPMNIDQVLRIAFNFIHRRDLSSSSFLA